MDFPHTALMESNLFFKAIYWRYFGLLHVGLSKIVTTCLCSYWNKSEVPQMQGKRWYPGKNTSSHQVWKDCLLESDCILCRPMLPGARESPGTVRRIWESSVTLNSSGTMAPCVSPKSSIGNLSSTSSPVAFRICALPGDPVANRLQWKPPLCLFVAWVSRKFQHNARVPTSLFTTLSLEDGEMFFCLWAQTFLYVHLATRASCARNSVVRVAFTRVKQR